MFSRFSVFILFFIGSYIAAWAQDASEVEQAVLYQECISDINVDNTKALLRARKWLVEGGAAPAQHCEAMALLDQGRFDDAADLLEKLGDRVSRGDGVSIFASRNKDQLALQLRYSAGKAWVAAEKIDRAYNIYTLALLGNVEGFPFSYDVYIERALVQLGREEYQSAVSDLTRALEITSEKVDAFLYRAETFRKMGEHFKARLDINEGLLISPNQPDLLFESGINYRMLRENEKAREEWQQLIKNYPDTEWQKLAEDNIKLIEG